MIIFLIALKAKQVARDWSYTCSLLNRTLASIYNQVNPDFKVLLVCHDKPDVKVEHPSLILYQVDFPIPNKTYEEMLLDRDLKELIGRQVAKNFNPDYIMVVDADDCLHRRIAEVLNQELTKPIVADGFLVDSGYIYYEKTKRFVPRAGFYQFCGSTLALRTELYDTPDSSSYESLLNFYNKGLFHSHGLLVNYWQSRGKVIKPFPFRGCIYVRPNLDPGLDTAKDIAHVLQKKDLKMLLSPLKRQIDCILKSKKVSEDIRLDFGFYTIEK